MPSYLKVLFAAMLLAVAIRAEDTPANPFPEIKADPGAWVNLISNVGLAAWKKQPAHDWQIVGEVGLDPNNDKALVAKPGAGVLYNGPKGRTHDVDSDAEFGDIAFHCEFMVSKGSNSGVYFMGSYELQIFDSFGMTQSPYPGIECAGIYQRYDSARGKSNEGFEGHSPKENVSKKPGEWQSFDVLFRAPKFDAQGQKTANAVFVKVLHNGKLVHENIELTGPTRGGAAEKATGPIHLQGDHGPVAFRNLRVLAFK